MGAWQLVAHFVAQPWGTVALLVAGCLLLYHDLLTPLTWGWTGTLGVIALGLVFAAHLASGTGGYIGVLFVLAGLAAILTEVHVLPGRGWALAGFALLFAGMFVALGGTHRLAFSFSVATFLIIISGLAFLAYLPKSPAWRRVGAQLSRRAEMARNEPDAYDMLLGQTGRSLTHLRPTGFAEIDGLRLAVVTEGEFLEPGATIVVTDVEDGRVVVHEQTTTERDGADAAAFVGSAAVRG